MWRAYLGLIRKEFIQVFRDRNMLRMIFAMPVVQLILFGYVVNIDVKNIAVDVYNYDRGQYSREFIDAFKAGGYFVLRDAVTDRMDNPLWTLDDRFKKRESEMALIIPEDFSDRLTQYERVTVGLIADGTDANSARIGSGYAFQIVQKFSQKKTGFTLPVQVRSKILYNPEAQSVYYMIPGIVATILTMLTVMLTSMAIVREREKGTLEQLLVTPMNSITLILGKISTFAILGIIEMIFTLVLGVLWFGIPFAGSPLLLFALSFLYLLTTLGMGMFFSNISSTQQQAMFFAWFFFVFAMLTSGFFTPISNMPVWMQYVTLINPMRYFMDIVRGIMMKGSGFTDLLDNIYALVIFGLTIFSFSFLRFKKRIV
ncbi:MAG: ABC transporter permease [candidate division Zixibacteria bacterium]|nr:ABC transporter permease [candidate division Zixibacteria bacterium]